MSRIIIDENKIRCSIVVDYGFTALEICKIRETIGADLIIVGKHGTSGNKDSFAGSNVLAIVRKSGAPVLVIPSETQKTNFENILFPIRPIEGTSVKFNVVVPIIRKNKSTIHLLGLTEGRNLDQLNKMENEFERVREKIESENILFSFEKTTSDDLAVKVLTSVEDKESDLLVLDNSYQTNGLLFSYYVHKIINSTKIPVLIVDPA